MITIFIQGTLSTPIRTPSLGGAGRGVKEGTKPKIVCYVNSGVFNRREFKNNLHFSFQGNPNAPWGGLGGYKGYTIKNHVLCQFWSFHQWRIQKCSRFSFQGTPKPYKSTLGGLKGVYHHKYVNSGVFNSSEFKNYLHFQGNPTPQGCPWGGGGNQRGYTTTNHVLYHFWTSYY